jgi:hypothetical protein
VEVDAVAKSVEAADEGVFDAIPIKSVEVIGTEVSVENAIAQDVIGGAKDGGGDGDDSLACAAPRLESKVPCALVATLGARGRPGGLYEYRFEPRCPLADAR